LSILFIFHYICLRLAKQSQFIPQQNVVYFITLPLLVRKIFTFYINDVLLLNIKFQGHRVKEILFRCALLLVTILAKLSLFDIRLEASTETNLIKSSSCDSRVRWFKHTNMKGSDTVSITDHCKRSE